MTYARRPMVAGNWKMHGNLIQAESLAHAIVAGLGDAAAEVVVCPPLCHLGAVRAIVEGSGVALGAQDVASWVDDGAFTGEVSSAMLADIGCSHVIVGHSERRGLLGESDAVVAEKYKAAQAGGVIPILCVGETREQREAGNSLKVVGAQLRAVMQVAGVASLANAVVAYEPVWAIGTGLTAAAEDAQEVHAHLRCLVADADATIAGSLRILYGGSVKPANAAELFAQADIDGGLIGGAALDAGSFLDIAHAANN